MVFLKLFISLLTISSTFFYNIYYTKVEIHKYLNRLIVKPYRNIFLKQIKINHHFFDFDFELWRPLGASTLTSYLTSFLTSLLTYFYYLPFLRVIGSLFLTVFTTLAALVIFLVFFGAGFLVYFLPLGFFAGLAFFAGAFLAAGFDFFSGLTAAFLVYLTSLTF